MLEEIISKEFVDRMKEDYNTRNSTVYKYAQMVISKYPFVLDDTNKFEEIVEEVVSSIAALSEDIYKSNELNKKEKVNEYFRCVSNLIDRCVEDHFDGQTNKYEMFEDYYGDDSLADVYAKSLLRK